MKNEPTWMLEWRLKAFKRLQSLKEPDWQKPKYPKIKYNDLYYFSAPKTAKDKPKSLDDVDPKLIETYKKLGIPLEEQKNLVELQLMQFSTPFLLRQLLKVSLKKKE